MNARQAIDDNNASVSILVPRNIKIELVQANALHSYEAFSFFGGASSNVATGFLASYFCTPNQTSYFPLAVGIVSAVIAIILGIFAWDSRRRMLSAGVLERNFLLKDWLW